MMTPTAALLRGFALPSNDVVPRPLQSMQSAETGAQRQGFRVGSMCLMIRYEDGSELAEMPSVFPLPNAPKWFAGLTNLHGALVPVFDPAPLLGVKRAEQQQAMLLVLGHGEDRTGMVIDGLPSRLKLSADYRLEQASIPPALRACVTEVYRIDGEDWMDFRYAPLLDHLEMQLQH
jgi:purine-binding chemotaxis protein CheW